MNDHLMTKEEAIVALCNMAQTADENQLRAIALAAKALARAGIHKRRVHASRVAHGIHDKKGGAK